METLTNEEITARFQAMGCGKVEITDEKITAYNKNGSLHSVWWRPEYDILAERSSRVSDDLLDILIKRNLKGQRSTL